MATYTYSGIGDLMLSMQEIAEIPDDVQDEILNSQADIVAQAIKQKGEAYGVHGTGETLKHIKKGKIKRDRDGNRCIYVTFSGKNKKGTRYAEIAFINNYGKKKQPARPFFTDALNETDEPCQKKAEQIYSNWLETKNL